MATPVQDERLDALAAAVAEERVHTVRVCFSDHYGVLRGRRLAAESFVADVRAPQAFCDAWNSGSSGFTLPRFIFTVTLPSPENSGSGMSIPCSRIQRACSSACSLNSAWSASLNSGRTSSISL